MVSNRVSFGVVIALIVGWGAMMLMFIQAGTELIGAEGDPLQATPSFPKGVNLRLTVDKNVYGPDDQVLISIRNDSRKQIWLAESIDGCRTTWWTVDQLQDGDNWQPIALAKSGCANKPSGTVAFQRHQVLTDSWDTLVPSSSLGDVVNRASTGTYRIRVDFLHDSATADDWASLGQAVWSNAFTIQ